MVRNYIITDREREMLKEYFETGKKLNGFRELKHFIGNIDLRQIEEDLALIKEFLKKESR